MIFKALKTVKTSALALCISAGLIGFSAQAENIDYLSAINSDLNASPLTFAKGELRWAKVGDLRPTQALIGYDQVNYKLGRYQAEPKKMYEEICESYGAGEKKVKWSEQSSPLKPGSFNCPLAIGSEAAEMKTAIVGPDGHLYLTDGHHTFSTFIDMENGGAQMPVLIKIQDNWSASESDSIEQAMSLFWQRLAQTNNSWQFTASGEAISYLNMPTTLGQDSLANQAFRALVYFARDISWVKKEAKAINFLEFHWGYELAKSISVDEQRLVEQAYYLSKIEEVAKQMLAYAPEQAIASSGRTAKQLGKKAAWDNNSDKTLQQLVCGSKKGRLGKLGFALSYKQPGASLECN
ncbi:ParB/Srx family N-terminal domain-containing protein [Agarivorans albus]